MEHWEQHFRHYDSHQMAYSKYLAMLDFHRNAQKTNAMILDSGCGTGNLSLKLLKDGHILTAVDNNEHALEILRKKCIDFSGNLVIRKLDLSQKLSFEDMSFDGVTSSLVIPFVKDVKLYIRENYRILRNGGIFSLSFAVPKVDLIEYVMGNMKKDVITNGIYNKDAWNLIMSTTAVNVNLIQEKNLTKPKLVKLLNNCGFRVSEKESSYEEYVPFLVCRK